MAIQTIATLKSYFNTGDIPTEAQFIDVFDTLFAQSPLTTKGDIVTYSTLNDRLAVGTNGQVLTADSTAATGLKWDTPSSGGITIGTTTVTGGATTQLLFNLAGVVSSSTGLTYASGLFTVLGTTQQAKVAYDASNHLGITIDSNGSATYELTGTTPLNIFNQSVGIGVTPSNAKLELLSTTEIMRMQYNSTNYTSFTPTSIGSLLLALEGTFPVFTVQARYSGVNYATLKFDAPNGYSVGGRLAFSNTNNAGNHISGGTADLNIAAKLVIISSSVNNPANLFLVMSSNATNHTTGTFKNANFKVTNFNPTSGSVPMYNVIIDGTINQTGTASGIARSLYIDQTLTAAADYRAIEVARGTTRLFHTSEQLRVGYDTTNHAGFTVGSTGSLTIALTGTTPTVIFSTKVQLSDVDLILGTTTGSKIGTATSQKLAFWNNTPVVQPTNLGASATVSHIGGGAMQENDTIGGYTLAQVVQALQTIGILA